MKKNLISFVSLLLFIITISVANINDVNALGVTSDNSYVNSSMLAQEEANQKKELEIYKKTLIEKYGNDYENTLLKNISATKMAEEVESNFEKNSSGETIYPENFGGMYINENNELVIQVVTDNNVNNFSLLNNSLEFNDDNQIEYVNNSYNDLNEVNDAIIEYFTNNGVTNSNFIANYVDVINNKVVVELKDISLSEQAKFKNEVVNSDLIEFKIGEEISLTSTYKSGSKITTTYQIRKYGSNGGYTEHNSGGGCSIAARAKRNGVVGYITAGHCFGYMDYDVVSATVNNGTYVTRKYTQTADFAFVKLGSGHSLSNDLAYPGGQASFIKTTGNNYFAVGTGVGKSGYASGYSFGYIRSLNYSYTDLSGYYHSGAIEASCRAIAGDSGGSVFITSATTLTNGAPLIGIVNGGNANTLVFYSYEAAVSSLGLTKY